MPLLLFSNGGGLQSRTEIQSRQPVSAAPAMRAHLAPEAGLALLTGDRTAGMLLGSSSAGIRTHLARPEFGAPQ